MVLADVRVLPRRFFPEATTARPCRISSEAGWARFVQWCTQPKGDEANDVPRLAAEVPKREAGIPATTVFPPMLALVTQGSALKKTVLQQKERPANGRWPRALPRRETGEQGLQARPGLDVGDRRSFPGEPVQETCPRQKAWSKRKTRHATLQATTHSCPVRGWRHERCCGASVARRAQRSRVANSCRWSSRPSTRCAVDLLQQRQPPRRHRRWFLDRF